MTMELKTVSHQPWRCHHVSHFCAGCSEVSRSGRTKLTFATTAIAMIQCIQVGMVLGGSFHLVSPLTGVIHLPNGLIMAYKWG